MDEGAARDLARDVIRPSGLLGYLVGRGNWWPNDNARKVGRRAIGQVMGGPIVAVIAAASSAVTSLITSGLLLMPAMFFVSRANAQSTNEADLEAEASLVE